MESRELLSITPLISRSTGPNPSSVVAEALSAYPTPPPIPGLTLDAATSVSPLIGTGPTKRELARERFRAVFNGPLYVGPGRFSDQAKTLYFRGLGNSNVFLHGDFQMAIVFPKDPASPLFGEAVMQDKNTNSQAILAFPLKGLTPQTYDRLGRPTRLTFSQDPNIYSGVFFINTSNGIVKIHYGAGSAKVVFTGLVYTIGLTNPLTNSDLYSRGGRIHPRVG